MFIFLQGRGWWKTADDPWQALATCMEIADAIRSPDPTQFISHQPVHQDGSCNGLQHYAALGQDTYGAKQVNLLPADRPQDVYEEVKLRFSVSISVGRLARFHDPGSYTSWVFSPWWVQSRFFVERPVELPGYV